MPREWVEATGLDVGFRRVSTADPSTGIVFRRVDLPHKPMIRPLQPIEPKHR